MIVAMLKKLFLIGNIAMKKILVLFFTFFLSSFIFASEKYTFDSSHSYVEWQVSHFGFSHPTGKWLVDGTLMLDENHPEKSTVEATIPVADIITGIPKLDEHLKGPDFFDTGKFQTATFVSKKVALTGKKTARVSGILTLHGVAKPVTLNVTLNKVEESPITHKKTAGFTATTKINRSAFGIDKYIPGVSDEVMIHIETEAYIA
jgi:polyisoprenoid-binding protein YceI